MNIEISFTFLLTALYCWTPFVINDSHWYTKYTYMYTYICKYVYSHMYIHVRIHVYKYMYEYANYLPLYIAKHRSWSTTHSDILYIHICILIYANMYIHICIFMYTYMYINICINMLITYRSVLLYTIRDQWLILIHYIYIYVYLYMQIYILTYAYSCIHTCV
jgi:hypothetical protein